MNNIVLNGESFTSKEALHEILKIQFGFPDYYGNNLDALWDCLTCQVQLPVTVDFINFKICKDNLGEYADALVGLLEDVSEYHKGEFVLNIK